MIGTGDIFSSGPSFDPVRLAIARELAGLTKTELAALIDKTPSALSQFESGRARPDPQTLRRISLAVGLPLAFFNRRAGTAPVPLDACHFRSLRSATQKDRRRLLAVATLLCELVGRLDEEFELPQDAVSPMANTPKDERGIEALADELRHAWGLGLAPIKNMVRLLEAKGVIVSPIVDGCEEVDAFSLWHAHRPLIFLVLDKHSPSRSRFDAAHELGHLVMHVDVTPASQEVERQANRFASAFLMPQAQFVRECPTRLNWDQLEKLKLRWGVSLAALVRRGRDLGVYTEATYRRACVQLNQRFNSGGIRRPEPNEPPPEVPTVIKDALAELHPDVGPEGLAMHFALSPSALRLMLPLVAGVVLHHDPLASTREGHGREGERG